MSDRFTFDSNLLIYADDLAEPVKQPISKRLVRRSMGRNCFVTQQAIGEFLNVGRRKKIADVVEIAATYRLFFNVVATSYQQLLDAAELADLRGKQFWDMVIVRVAADAGATMLLTEDIGDGETIAGVRIVNPLDPANTAVVEALFA